MNKAELINAAAEKAGLSKKDTESVISAAIDAITRASPVAKRFSWLVLGLLKLRREPSGSAAIPRPRKAS